jgi:hypothetical protein
VGVHGYWVGHTYGKIFVHQKHALFGFVRMYPLFKVWMPGQCICFVIRAGFMNESEVKFGEE